MTIVIAGLAVVVQWGAVGNRLDNIERSLVEIKIDRNRMVDSVQEIDRRLSRIEGRMNL